MPPAWLDHCFTVNLSAHAILLKNRVNGIEKGVILINRSLVSGYKSNNINWLQF